MNNNNILLKNVDLLSKLSEQEVSMMPATEAPLPSVEQVKQIVALVKADPSHLHTDSR